MNIYFTQSNPTTYEYPDPWGEMVPVHLTWTLREMIEVFPTDETATLDNGYEQYVVQVFASRDGRLFARKRSVDYHGGGYLALLDPDTLKEIVDPRGRGSWTSDIPARCIDGVGRPIIRRREAPATPN